MRHLFVLDAEGDELRPHATTLWCVVIKNPVTEKVVRFYDGDRINPGDLHLSQLQEYIHGCILIMHNGVGYDKWLLKKTLNIDIPIPRIIDTLKLSQILYPDLKVPVGWKGMAKPHSVEAYGMRYGIAKPTHEDWSRFSPEMLHRCETDVHIQTRMYIGMIEDMKKL